MDRSSLKKKFLHSLGPLLGLFLFILALWILHHGLKAYSYHDILFQLKVIPLYRLSLALVLTLSGYLVLTAYDTLAFRYIHHPLAYRKIALTSFIGYAFSHNIGHSLISSGPIRYRLYSNWGLSAIEITKVVGFLILTFWLGSIAVGGPVFLFEPGVLSDLLHLPPEIVRAIGILCLILVSGFLLSCALIRKPLTIREWEFPLPSLRLSLFQIAVASLDWIVAGSVLYTLLPGTPNLSYPSFLGIFLVAQTAGLASLIPGGVGVFESVILLSLSSFLPASSIIGSLIAYRVIYYLLPLGIASGLLAAHEVFRKRAGLGRVARLFGQWVPWLVPHGFALATFIGGAILLFSGVTPPVAWRLLWLKDLVPLPVLEVSHFMGSLVGIGLLLLARSLQRRLDAAYHLTLALLGTGVIVSLLKGLDYEEAAILAILFGALLSSRRYFYRKASLIGDRFTPEWVFAIVLVLLGSVWLEIFAHRHVEYSGELWWRFALSADAPRTLRATLGAIIAALIFAIARLLRPAAPDPSPPGPDQLAKCRAIVAGSRKTYAQLALSGDKTLLFNGSENAFIMYAVEGRSWVALGDPVGPEAETAELVWLFRELCDRHDGWTVFYGVGGEFLDLYLELGLTLLKLGEEARVPLAAFSLEGGKRRGLRQVLHRMEKEGYTFQIVRKEEISALLPELKEISDAWLATKTTREKGFSLGSFEPGYLTRFPAGVVQKKEKIVAFANILLGAEKEEISLDLMRYSPDVHSGIMEYLFLSLMLWGKGEGYRWFSLGMAPLSGLENRMLSPLWNRIGAWVYRHGEHFYNFQGLREYKEKFDPDWRPKYLASPGGLSLPRVLSDIAILIGGGVKGVISK